METHAEKAEPVTERRGWWRWRRAVERPEVSRFWCLALLALAVAALCITAYGNVQFNAQLGLDAAGKQTFIAQSLLIDGFLVTLSAIAGGVWRGGRWFSSILLLALAAGYLAYSAGSYVGFGIGQRLGSTMIAEAKQADAKEVAKTQNGLLVDGRKTVLQALSTQFKRTRSRRERARIINKLAKLAETPVALKSAKIEPGAKDSTAKAFSHMLGWDMQTAQLAITTFGALLVVLAKFLGPYVAIAFWPRKPLRWFSRRKGAELPVALAVDPAARALPGPASQAAIDLDREREKALVREFFETQTARVAPTQTAKANDVYDWFRDWCQKTKKLGSVMTLTRFGRLTVDLDYAKERDRGRVVYRGLARKAAPAIPEEPRARRKKAA